MLIHLLNDHTALLMDDRADTVTVTPATGGVLEIDGVAFTVASSGTPMSPMKGAVGSAAVIFTDERGVRYVGVRPRYKDGIPYTAVDFTAEYFNLRLHVDRLERELEQAVAAVHKLAANYHPNALGFLTGNTRNTEE